MKEVPEVQCLWNKYAEDGRVHVVEPRAREALKKSSNRKDSGGSEA